MTTMTAEDWPKLKHFTEMENWGEASRMDRDLVFELDAFRSFVDTPIAISCGTGKQHLEDSQHYMGRAVDILFPGKELTDLFGLAIAALRFRFNGFGIYPHWEYGGKVIGGLHLDTREWDGHRAFWMGVEQDGKQAYIDLSPEHLRAYNLI